MTEQQAQTNQANAAAAATVTVDRLARIETKLDGMKEDRTTVREELAGHSTRIDRVERFMWLAVGMSFASGVPAVLRALGQSA